MEKPMEGGATALFLAAESNHVNIVKALIEAGADANKARGDRITPLFIAAHEGHVHVVSALLAAGARMDKGMKNGYRPLHKAAANGNADVVKALLNEGEAQLKMQNLMDMETKKGNTPLNLAAQNGHLEVVKVLVEENASQVPNKNGQAPLVAAIRVGNIAMARLLLTAGADKYVLDGNNFTPLLFAAFKGRAEIFEDLLVAGCAALHKYEGIPQSQN
jgi:ankyrin repeat protein